MPTTAATHSRWRTLADTDPEITTFERPSDEELEILRRWIEANAPVPGRPARPFRSDRDVLVAERGAEGFYRRLGETGIHSISMNETWVGVGVAPDHFREFMKPYDAECVQAAHDAGAPVPVSSPRPWVRAR